MKINWKWPSTEINNLHPWYKYLYRIPAEAVLMVAMVIAYLCMVILTGVEGGKDFVSKYTGE